MILRTRHLFIILMMLLRRDVHDLEYNPAVQFKWHLVMTYTWFLAMAGFTIVWFATFGFGSQFTNGSLWLLFFTLWVSLYANFATDFDAMSAALAALHASRAETAAQQKETV